jgi:glycerol-1-phosphate dehydrogenase [NAD(P)+]
MGGATKIEQLLRGTYRDPDSGAATGVTTRSLVIAASLKGLEADLIDGLGFGRKLAIIADTTTFEVLGTRVADALAGRYEVQAVVMPAGPHPDGGTVARVRKATAQADALIAVGSGTLNDVAKYASALDAKPYAVFATAASMNGYTSVNAAITMHGHKLSLPAHAPVGAFFDLSVLSAAPMRLTRAGLGDSLCRTTSQADWLLAHMLFDQPYRKLPYDLLADDEAALFAQADALVAGDTSAMERLVRTLVLSGFGTAIVGHSQPASQGEHLISHYIDMLCSPKRPLVYHGEQVGVTTLSMARLQERLLDRKPRFHADVESRADLEKHFGPELGASCWSEFEKKRLDGAKADALNAHVEKIWPEVQNRIAPILLSSAHLTSVLTAAGADLTPQAIHLPPAFYQQALLRSREIRNRYTFLDLAANTRCLADSVATL